jgi:hypothetical protein
VPTHAQTLKARMHVFAAFDEKGLSSLRVNGFGINSSSSSDMECAMQLVQAAALHVQPILRLQRDLLPPATTTPLSPDSFAPSLFASVSGAAAHALLSAAPHLPPRDLYPPPPPPQPASRPFSALPCCASAFLLQLARV